MTFPFSGTQSGAIPPTQSPPPPEPQVLCQPGLDNGQVEWARRKVLYQSTIKHVSKNARITIEFISFSTFSFLEIQILFFRYLIFVVKPAEAGCLPDLPRPAVWHQHHQDHWNGYMVRDGRHGLRKLAHERLLAEAITFKSQSISANFSAIRLHWVLF